MKKSKKCIKCNSTELVKIKGVSSDKSSKEQMIMNLGITDKLAGLTLGLPKGAIEMISCRQCGYSELYIRDPSSIEVDETIISSY